MKIFYGLIVSFIAISMSAVCMEVLVGGKAVPFDSRNTSNDPYSDQMYSKKTKTYGVDQKKKSNSTNTEDYPPSGQDVKNSSKSSKKK